MKRKDCKFTWLEVPEGRPLPFYLAAEEWVAANVDPELMPVLFTWQADKTVIFGRNQSIDDEVDIDYCLRHGIDMCRRKSGGGCVYADMSNVMFSFVTRGDNVAAIFTDYTERIARMLRTMGFDARAGSRNDVFVGDGKVSGNAFYHSRGCSIAHGTMLWDADPCGHLARAITPSRAKLAAKGVVSVASRVTTLRTHQPGLTLEEFKHRSRELLCGERVIRPDIRAIERIEMPYHDPRWIYGRKPRAAARTMRRIEGVGEFVVDLDRDAEGRITHVDLHGDFFVTADLDAFLAQLRGLNPTVDPLPDPSGVIVGLTADSLRSLVTA